MREKTRLSPGRDRQSLRKDSENASAVVRKPPLRLEEKVRPVEYAVIAFKAPLTGRLPPNCIDFLTFRVLWRNCTLRNRLGDSDAKVAGSRSSRTSDFLRILKCRSLPPLGGARLGWRTVVKPTHWDVSAPTLSSGPLPERITKNVLWRAVDVNRPVRPWYVSGAAPAARARTVTGGSVANFSTRLGSVRRPGDSRAEAVFPAQSA
jgi:hypothetical protein